ncbi:MAG TPA: diguanylate cyclase [Burkholderiaceae bacterium]|nr:diguanylate cyclase [Burkholderiaceae bacterium]
MPASASALIEHGRRQLDSGALREALSSAEAALVLARGEPDSADRAEALLLVGQSCRLLAEHQRALAALADAETLFRSRGNASRVAEALLQCGHVHLGVGDFGAALALFEQALATIGDLADAQIGARVMRCLAMACTRLGDLDAAHDHYMRALAIHREQGDRNAVATNLNSLAVLECRRAEGAAAGSPARHEHVAAALPMFEEAIALARAEGNQLLLAQSHANLGLAYGLLGDHRRLIDSETQSLEIFSRQGARQDELQSLVSLGSAHRELGLHDEALALLVRARDDAAQLGLKPRQAAAELELSRLHEGAGRPAEALLCFKRFHELDRQLQDDSARRQALRLAAREEVARAQREIEAHRRRAAELSGENQSLARQAAELDRLAYEDALTGLPNRRRLERWLSAHATLASGCSIGVADVDRFKSINDRYSHATGDRVLAAVGSILHRHHRAQDLVARYGGEEFVLVFAEASLGDAYSACERIRQAVEQHDWTAIEPGLAVTLSLGVARGEAGADAHALLREADACLLAAKRDGRNRTVSAGAATPAREDTAA